MAQIPAYFIQDILNRIDIVDLVQSRVLNPEAALLPAGLVSALATGCGLVLVGP